MPDISLPSKVSTILTTLKSAGFEAYIVGGCVRDTLIGRLPQDWDITTSARPQEVKALFRRTVDTGLQNGTVTVLLGPDSFEVTTFRADGAYSDARHPDEVRFVTSLSEDLARRDFTINAMAYEPDAGVVDLFGGRADLEAGLIRAVGDPAERFTEDALRMLRAVRFSAQLGFEIEEETFQAIRPLAPRLSMVSRERIRDEINKLLLSDHPDYFEKLAQCGITAAIMPRFDEMLKTPQQSDYHLFDVGHHTLKVMKASDPTLLQRVCALLHDTGKTVSRATDENGDHFKGHMVQSALYADTFLREMRYDNHLREMAVRLIRVHDIRISVTPASVRRLASAMGTDLFPEYLRFIPADNSGKSSLSEADFRPRYKKLLAIWDEIVQRGDPLTLKDLAVDGQDLIRAGKKPGKALGECLAYLLRRVLADPQLNTKDKLMQMAFETNETVNEKYQKALDLIRAHDTIIIHRHTMPDGDAAGSQTGLRRLLRDNFPDKSIYSVGDAADRFSFLPGSQPVPMADEVFPRALCIILDCGSPSLISDDRWQKAHATIRFDHHLFQGEIAQVDISDSSFESACGLVSDFAFSCGLTVTPEAATALYMGMVTDSGRFRYDSTTPRTLRLAASLLEKGIDTNELYLNLYSTTPKEVKQRAYFAMKIRYTPGGVAYLYNSAEEVKELGMSTFDVSRGMVGVMADLKGVDIWVNFTESESGILAELRSSLFTVQPIAVKYGGGGHAKACGATLKDKAEVEAMLADLDAVRSQGHE